MTVVAEPRGVGSATLPAPAALLGLSDGAGSTQRIRPLLSRLGGILSAILSGAATGVLLFAIGMLITGHRETTVLSGSMSPHLPVGTLVVTERVSASSVRAGDVIVFPKPGRTDQTVIHRVVRIAPTGDGALQAHTRGDANAGEDPWVLRVSPDTRVDRGIAAFAGVGGDIAQIRRVAVEIVIVLVATSILWYGLRRVWSR